MKARKRDFYFAICILALLFAIIYVIVRTLLLFFAEYGLIEKIFAVCLMLSEFFILLHSIGYVQNIIRVMRSERKKETEPEKPVPDLTEEPAVAILVAARHEPKDVLAETFITLNNIDYKNKNVYFLDDSSDPKYLREAEELAEEYNLNLFRRTERHGAKAGVVNDCLKTLKEKYVAVFDADQQPLPGFLNALIPILENNKKLAFVQTPQFYTNIEDSRVARGSAFQQAVFYEYICEGKSITDSMFCCGTNVVFRTKALLEVGGFDESTVTEDFATSIKLHLGGWKSYYYNHTCAFGMGPEDLASYFKQQFRWATGTVAVFRKLLGKLFTKPFSLSPVQWWEYILSSTYYFVGIAYFFLMICPVLYILFRIPSFFAKPEVYFLTYAPYIIFTMGVFHLVLGSRGYRKRDLLIGQLLGLCSFPVYIKGALSALVGIKTTFGVTGKTRGKSVPYIKLWPQLLFIFLFLISIVWGINRFIYERNMAIIVNMFWALYHMILLCGIFYFNEEGK